MTNSQNLYNKGHLNDTGVNLYVDALRLNKEDLLPEDLLEHVENCKTCRSAVFQYYQFVKEEDVSELESHPFFSNKESQKQKTKVIAFPYRKITSIAAAIALIIGISFIMLNSKIFNNSPNDIASSDSTNKENKELMALNEQIPFYDRQIKKLQSTRGVIINQPEIDAIFNDVVIFSWEETSEYQMELEVFTKKTQEKPSKYLIPAGIKSYALSPIKVPGLYYWKLSQLDEKQKKKIGLGRFYVNPKPDN